MSKAIQEAITSPPAAAFETLTVGTADMRPAINLGDVVYFNAPGHGAGLGDISDRECVAEPATGGHQAHQPLAGGGLLTLSSYEGVPQRGVQLAFAAPVVWVQGRARAGMI